MVSCGVTGLWMEDGAKVPGDRGAGWGEVRPPRDGRARTYRGWGAMYTCSSPPPGSCVLRHTPSLPRQSCEKVPATRPAPFGFEGHFLPPFPFNKTHL